MPAETPFRLALGGVLVLNLAVVGYFRWQAAQSAEPISRRDEGCAFAGVLRLAGLSLLLATLGYLAAPHYLDWAALPLPDELRWAAAVAGALCSLALAWTLRSLGRNLTDTVTVRRQATLVTHGPYRWVRHPYYVASALLMASATLLAANALIGAAAATVLLLLAVRTPQEERMLLDRFGDDYRRYMARTGRYFPRLFRGAGGPLADSPGDDEDSNAA